MNFTAYHLDDSARRSPMRCSAGFSLVEVTLAVAIASLGLITFLGLLPQGLEMSRKTSLMMSQSNILEQAIRDLENARWSSIKTSPKTRFYYDYQGGSLDASSNEVNYVVEVDATQQSALPTSNTAQAYLRRVVVRVASTADVKFEFTTGNAATYSTFNHLVARTR